MLLEWEAWKYKCVFLIHFIKTISSMGPALIGDFIWVMNPLKASDRPLQFTKLRRKVLNIIEMIMKLKLHLGPCHTPDPLPLLSSQTGPKISACPFCFSVEIRKSRSVYPSRKCYFIELTLCKLLPQMLYRNKVPCVQGIFSGSFKRSPSNHLDLKSTMKTLLFLECCFPVTSVCLFNCFVRH